MDAFGSCAEAMGSIAGRCDGIAGAVECQKSTGSLHLHFWCYAQRLLEEALPLKSACMTAPLPLHLEKLLVEDISEKLRCI